MSFNVNWPSPTTISVFSKLNMNYKDYVDIDKKFMRPADVDTLLADYTKAKKILKWEPKITFDNLVISMVEHDLRHVKE